jgi:hypothetical protein
MKIRIATLSVGLALVSVATACGDKAGKKTVQQPDSSLARDLALAGAQTSQQPTFQDTSVAPAPTRAAPAPRPEAKAPVRTKTSPRPRPEPPKSVAQAPAPTPPHQQAPAVMPQPIAPAPAATPAAIQGEVAAGTTAGLTAGSKMCSQSNQPGDKMVATLNTALVGTNGKEIPAGSTVVLELASSTPAQSADAAQITFRVRSIVVNDKQYTVDAEVIPTSALDKAKMGGDNDNTKKVAGGAIAGAILGQIIGHNTKGTLIGAAAGAAAGAAVAKSGEKWEACLQNGGQLRLRLNAPLVIS